MLSVFILNKDTLSSIKTVLRGLIDKSAICSSTYEDTKFCFSTECHSLFPEAMVSAHLTVGGDEEDMNIGAAIFFTQDTLSRPLL